MPIKSVKMKISKNKKMRFFLMSQGSFDPKIRFIGQKVCSVARVQTDRHSYRHESEYRGHPFRVSGTTYHQGSVQVLSSCYLISPINLRICELVKTSSEFHLKICCPCQLSKPFRYRDIIKTNTTGSYY